MLKISPSVATRRISRVCRGPLLIILGLCGCGVRGALALGPHEIAVLVNANSSRSREVANHFVSLRGVPYVNVIYLDVPDSALEPEASLTPADFARYIWEPANRRIDERGIRNHILAWVYSVDFPVRITTTPALSLQGITFLRNRIPDADIIKGGSYRSPFFAGPDKPDGPHGSSLSLEQYLAVDPKADLPLPSMMLGFMGARGNELKAVLDCLARGVSSDGRKPAGRVYLVKNKDIRSTCRDWQFPGVRSELLSLGAACDIVNGELRQPQTAIAGFMTGNPWVTTYYGENGFVLGCMAEHLTSSAAIFDDYDQTKMTEWIQGGATATAGTVSEPHAIWTKFPHARFFAHQARGCTMIEGLFQSLRCPLQTLLIGEPLAKPYAPDFSVVIEEEPGNDEHITFSARVQSDEVVAVDFMWLLDGVTYGAGFSGPEMTLRKSSLSTGWHTVRAIAYAQGPMRHQAFSTHDLFIARHGRDVTLANADGSADAKAHEPLRLHVSTGSVRPKNVSIISGGRTLAVSAGATDAVIRIDSGVIEPGPHMFHAVASYSDGDTALSHPLSVNVIQSNKQPTISAITEKRMENGHTRLIVSASDPEEAPIELRWFRVWPWAAESDQESAAPLRWSGGRRTAQDTDVDFRSEQRHDTAILQDTDCRGLDEIALSVRLPPEILKDQIAAIVFNARSPGDFDFFGLLGDKSSWSFGRCHDGHLERVVSRGRFLRNNEWHYFSIRRRPGGGLDASVNGEVICSWPEGRFARGGAGILAGSTSVTFRDLSTSPPGWPENAIQVQEQDGCTEVISAAGQQRCVLMCRVSDGHRFSFRRHVLRQGNETGP